MRQLLKKPPANPQALNVGLLLDKIDPGTVLHIEIRGRKREEFKLLMVVSDCLVATNPMRGKHPVLIRFDAIDTIEVGDDN